MDPADDQLLTVFDYDDHDKYLLESSPYGDTQDDSVLNY